MIKARVKKAKVRVTRSSVIIFWYPNFNGPWRTLVGNIAIRDLKLINFLTASLKLDGDDDTTLILFSEPNYQGNRKIISGEQDMKNLGKLVASGSLILSHRIISEKETNRIQRTRRPPGGFAELSGGKK